jgi:hypothetical protein
MGQGSTRALILAAAGIFAAPQASAQSGGSPIIVAGTCDSKSGVTIDSGELSRLECDTAVVMRTDRGTVLIQFTDKAGDDGRILGFAGTIEGKQGFGADATQMVAVDRLYLAGGAAPVPVQRGTCIMNWTGLQRTGGKLVSMVCGARAEAEGSDIRAIAALTVK